MTIADAGAANIRVSLDDCDKKTFKSDGWILKRSDSLSPLPTPSTFIIWEKDRSGPDHRKEPGRFLQCLMEHSENHSNVSSTRWHPIAPINTWNTHEGMPLPSVNELSSHITPWKSRNKAITCNLSTFRRARRKTVLETAQSPGIGYAVGLGYGLNLNTQKNACTSSTVNLLSQSQ